MSKMKIIYVGTFRLPDLNASALRVKSNGKLLEKLGYQVHYLSTYKSSISNVEDESIISCNFERGVHFQKNYRLIEEQLNKIHDLSIIIAYNLSSYMLYKLYKFSKKKNIIIIGDITEWYSFSSFNFPKNLYKSLDTFFRMRVLNFKMDGLIVISNYLKRVYKKKNVIVIPPLVDKTEEKWKSGSAIECNESYRLVYAGSPGKNKDRVNCVIEALSKVEHNKYSLSIIGLSRDTYCKENPQHIQLLMNNSNIEFIGKLNHNETLSCVASSDFLIFARKKTRLTLSGFPTKLVESISLGVPVITNITSNIEKYLVDNINAINVNFYDKNEFISKINCVFDSNIRLKGKFDNNIFDYNNRVDDVQKFINLLCKANRE